jgi:hypothetical protein
VPFFGSRARIGPTAVRAFSRMEHPARTGWLSLRRGVRPPVHCVKPISPMSAVGQKQTLHSHLGMSALPPKADIDRCSEHVRLVPGADIETHRRGAGHSAPIANVDRRAGDTASGRASNLSQMASASRIRFVIASGCEISARWLASISIVFAPIRFAMKRSRSGLMVRSWVDTA